MGGAFAAEKHRVRKPLLVVTEGFKFEGFEF